MLSTRWRRYLDEYQVVLSGAGQKLPWIVGMMLAVAVLDLLSVSMMAPLLFKLMGSEAAEAGGASYIASLARFPFWQIAAFILLLLAVRGVLGYRLQYRIALFSHGHRVALMDEILAAFQRQPLEVHLKRKASEGVGTLVEYTGLYADSTLSASLKLLSDLLVVSAISVILAITDPRMFVAVAATMGLAVLGINRWVRSRIVTIGRVLTRKSVDVLANATAAIEGYRDIKTLGAEAFFRQRLKKDATALATHRAWLQALSTLPRYVIELMIAALLLAAAALALAGEEGALAIPIMASFAFGAIKLMPAASSTIRHLNSLRVSRPVLARLAAELRTLRHGPSPPPPQVKDGPSFSRLEFRDVSFTYPGSERPAIDGLSLTIARGEVIGVLGRSGAGKSTFADLMLGLLTPTQGVLELNGQPVAQATMAHTAAYVPQAAFLIADSIAANVALRDDALDVDHEAIARAVDQAQLTDYVAGLPDGLAAEVSERGSSMSGGQRQRLALARALYHQRELIVLDEATSALDGSTERALVGALESLGGERTLIVIAHRESTLRICSRILAFEEGRLIADGGPELLDRHFATN